MLEICQKNITFIKIIEKLMRSLLSLTKGLITGKMIFVYGILEDCQVAEKNIL